MTTDDTGAGGNLHVALALALGVQPAERDRELVARVYRLLHREPPARAPRGLNLRDALVLALGVSPAETDAQLIARVSVLATRRQPTRLAPRARDTDPGLFDAQEGAA